VFACGEPYLAVLIIHEDLPYTLAKEVARVWISLAKAHDLGGARTESKRDSQREEEKRQAKGKQRTSRRQEEDA
jgi:hypothetical protein